MLLTLYSHLYYLLSIIKLKLTIIILIIIIIIIPVWIGYSFLTEHIYTKVEFSNLHASKPALLGALKAYKTSLNSTIVFGSYLPKYRFK